MRNIIIGLCSLFVVLFVFFGIIRQSKHSPKDDNHLNLVLPFDVPSLDVHSRAHDANAAIVIRLLFEGLMTLDSMGNPEHALAHKFDRNEDGTKYTFYLRNAMWSDGVPITAGDFEYSWKRALDPDSKHALQNPHYFYSIKNAENCTLRNTPIDALGVRAIDDKTLEVELEYSDPYFLRLVSSCFSVAAPKHIALKDEKWATKPDMVSNGPFVVKDWKLNNVIKVEKNPCYWNREKVALDEIEFQIVPSSLTALHMFEKGQLDWFGDPIYRMPADFYENLEKKKLINKKEGGRIYWFFLNTEKYPLHNKKLRKALSYSIDRDSLLANIFYSYGISARSILAPILRGKNIEFFQDSSEIAKQLFQEALEELGISKDEFPPLEMRCVESYELHNQVSQAIQDQWKKVLGINISIRKNEWHSHYHAMSSGNYDIGFMSWNIDIGDPKYLLQVFEDKNAMNNMSFWGNPEYKSYIQKLRTSIGEKERESTIYKAESIIMEDMPVIPIVFLNMIFAKTPSIKGEVLTPFSPIDFKLTYFEQSKPILCP